MARWERFRRLFGPDPAADVDDELSFHVEMRVQELVGRGELPERARELALRRFGEYDARGPSAYTSITSGGDAWREQNC